MSSVFTSFVSTIVLTLGFLLSAHPLFAQPALKVNFQFLPIEDGSFPRKLVNYLHQDQKGGMWIATNFGLTRFDGTVFSTLFYKEEQEALIHLDVILEDAEGQFWMIPRAMAPLKQKIFVANAAKTSLQALETWPGFSGLATRSQLLDIGLSAEKRVQLLTTSGTLLEVQADHSLKALPLPSAFEPIGLAGPDLVYGRQDGTVRIYDLKIQRFEPFNLKDNPALHIENFAPGSYFVYGKSPEGTQQCGVIYQGQHIYRGALKELAFDAKQGLFWGSTIEDFQLVAIDTAGRQVYPLPGLDEQPFHYAVFDMMVDRQGILWVGTAFGVYQLKVYPNYFKRYLHREVDPQAIEDTYSCRGILEAAPDKLWVNTSQGTFEVNRAGGSATLLDRDTFENALNFPLIHSRNEAVWTARQDLRRLDPGSGRLLQRYPAEQRLSAWALLEAADGTIWIGDTHGLYYFHPDKHQAVQTFRQYNAFEELAQAGVLHFHQDAQGRIWVASSKGLYVLEGDQGITARYWKGGEAAYYLPSSRFYFIYEDAEGVFWLATNGDGLIRFDPRRPARSPLQFTNENGLASNVLYAVFEDDREQLWMSSNWGIIRFDKRSYAVQTYLPEHGLSHFEFNRTSALQTPEGQIYFGGLNGITSFHPSDFYTPEPYQAPLVVTAFRRLDIAEDTLQDGLYKLEEEGRIVIRPNHPFFMLSFGLQDYWKSEEHQFQYLIEGYVDRWTTLNGNTLNLSGLPYGDWTLRVRGRTGDGRLSSRELSVDIEVQRPLYLNPAVWAVVFLLLVVLILRYLRWRTRQFRKREEQLEQKVASRTATIREQAEKLRELDELKSRFFANVSHELRTPLTLILGPAEALLRKGQLDNDVYKKLAQIYGNAKKMLQQTNDILDLAKLESNSLKLEPKATDLFPFLKQLLDTFEQQAVLKGLELHICYGRAESVQVWIDREKVGQVISNLLSNALKFTDEGRVELSVDYDEDQLKFTVEDSGRGIAEEDRQHVFDRFYQGSGQEVAQKGTGIGLSLCKELVEWMQGQILVESAVGQGSRFIVRLPRVNAPAPATEVLQTARDLELNLPLKPSTAPVPATGQQILLVEDNDDLRHYIQGVLQEAFAVESVADGQAAWEVLAVQARQNLLPQLIISDIMMPRMDGLELLEKLRQDDRFRHLPVIMLTARTEDHAKLSALRAGVDDYIHKPFLEEELIARVQHLIRHYKGRETPAIRPDLKRDLSGADLHWLEKVEHFTMEHLSHAHFSVAFLTEQLAMSERQFQRRIKQMTGLSPNKYIREIRLVKARALLEGGEAETVAEVAHAVGFDTPAYFSTLFQERFGRKPIDFL